MKTTLMGKIIRIDHVKSILMIYQETKSITGTAKRLTFFKNIVRIYPMHIPTALTPLFRFSLTPYSEGLTPSI